MRIKKKDVERRDAVFVVVVFTQKKLTAKAFNAGQQAMRYANARRENFTAEECPARIEIHRLDAPKADTHGEMLMALLNLSAGE